MKEETMESVRAAAELLAEKINKMTAPIGIDRLDEMTQQMDRMTKKIKAITRREKIKKILGS